MKNSYYCTLMPKKLRCAYFFKIGELVFIWDTGYIGTPHVSRVSADHSRCDKCSMMPSQHISCQARSQGGGGGGGQGGQLTPPPP